MNYEICSKNDLLTGMSLVIKIPEDALDKKALYTIQAEQPDFLLPFRYRNVDGEVEFIYQIGTKNKLQYLSGNRTPGEYAGLWTSILTPLMVCGDWFMNPCSFILSADHLYFDKVKKMVSYVYIPSVEGCSGYGALKEMAAEVSKLFSVSDTVLENNVLKAIMKDFNPNEFLRMLKKYSEDYSNPVKTDPAAVMQNNDAKFPDAKPGTGSQEQAGLYRQESIRDGFCFYTQDVPVDVMTDIPVSAEFSIKADEKISKGNKNRGNFFGKKKDVRQEVISLQFPQQDVPREFVNHVQVFSDLADISVQTQSIQVEAFGTGLRYAGRASMPRFIPVEIAAGEIFTIGRFDSDIGKQQSSFEFDKKTKAVSRRHAVIERDACGYKIVDISSSAGTFVNEQKLPPNTPCALEKGCRVSFGNSGADYVWEAG